MWIDDHLLAQCHEDLSSHIFVPPYPMVVKARSTPLSDCHLSTCQSLDIEVKKRLGGGGAVVLYEGCVVISLGMWVDRFFESQMFFSLINQALIWVLTHLLHLHGVYQDGHSDLVYRDQKCLGGSLFRSKRYLLYQGSLLVDLDLNLINRCLAHPATEPSYRQGKSHNQFLTSLSHIRAINQKPPVSAAEVALVFQSYVLDGIRHHLQDYLRPSDPNHCRHLKSRISHEYPHNLPTLPHLVPSNSFK